MKPSDFLIGIRDLFIFLVPGAIFLLLFDPQLHLFVELEAAVGGLGLFAFAFIAYGLGSFASAGGAFLDPIADRLVEKTHETTLARLADAFEEEILRQATETRDLAKRPWTPKAFWWDQIRLHYPVGIAEVDRLESIHKLFRALTIVFLAHAALIVAAGDRLPPGDWRMPLVPVRSIWFNLVAAVATFGLYVRNRRKFADTIYRLSIALSIPIETIAKAREQFGLRAAAIFAEEAAKQKESAGAVN